ncbi:MAG: AMP phosphorylase [Candidatus Nanoarchaeia archaeon]|nr:AMP phosphorylase [Candidatus Nanoarchaeia archaeon]
MKLKVKSVNFSSGGPLVAVLNTHDASNLDLKSLDRIKIKKERKEIVVAVDISKDSKIKRGSIGLFEEVTNLLKLKDKTIVNISVEPKPISLQYIKKKLDGDRLTKIEINEIIKDIVENRLTEVEITYFVSGCYVNGLSLYESAYLTEAITDNGKRLNLNKYPILDKHSISGIPGNRTTMIIIPIVTALGYIMPKTSTRSITSASGTSDTMEVLAPVEHSVNNIRKIIKEVGGCMVWGGALELASADDKLIKVEKTISLDPEGIMLASILAKKFSVGATHIILDIPWGKGSKVESMSIAKRLKRKFEFLGKLLGMEIRTYFSDGRQPVGNGIGPALEARDVLMILENKGPKDLKEKAVKMASILLSMVGVKNSYNKALGVLESGLALKKMKEIIKAQGGNPNISSDKIKLGKFRCEIRAKNSGIIKEISNKSLVKIAKVAGAPEDQGAGIFFNVKLNEKVKKNQILFFIFAENKKRLQYAKHIYNNSKVITLENG